MPGGDDIGEADVLVGVGSNIAPERNVPAAAVRLLACPGVELLAASTLYRAPPIGRSVGPAEFVNGVFVIRTTVPVRAIKARVLRPIERALGRDGSNRTGPRPIDLDLIAIGDRVVDIPGLVLPDPDWLTRAFIATPIAELVPDLRHPIDGRTAREIARAVGVHELAPDNALTARTRALTLEEFAEPAI